MNKMIPCAVVLLALGSAALATKPPWEYRIKLTKNTGDLDIAVQTFTGPAVTVGLENRSGKTAHCRASFVGYPHKPSPDEFARATVAAGKRATLAYPLEKLGGSISTAFVDLTCSETRPES